MIYIYIYILIYTKHIYYTQQLTTNYLTICTHSGPYQLSLLQHTLIEGAQATTASTGCYLQSLAGALYRILNLPSTTSLSLATSFSSTPLFPLRIPALTPRFCRQLTWSTISDTRGETTKTMLRSQDGY